MKISSLLASVVILSALSSQSIIAQSLQPTDSISNPQIDYAGFLKLTEQLSGYRTERLVNLNEFNMMAEQDDAVILDTRSAAAFARGHIGGAINIPFSDFTEEKLVKILGNKSRPVLIYCNNNFRDNIPPIALKRAPLALNIPTFINLYGYGYKNIYELDDIVHIADPRVNWTSKPLAISSAPPIKENPSEDAPRAN